MRAADGCDREVRTTEELARRMRAGRAPQAKDLGKDLSPPFPAISELFFIELDKSIGFRDLSRFALS